MKTTRHDHNGDWRGIAQLRGAMVLVLSVCALSGTASCSKQTQADLPVVPVSGKAFFQGKPIANAQIVLHPVAAPSSENVPRPRAAVEKDGAFRLSTYTLGDGAPKGRYAVTISWKAPYQGKPEDADRASELLPARYQDPNRSGLSVVVADAPVELKPFELKK